MCVLFFGKIDEDNHQPSYYTCGAVQPIKLGDVLNWSTKSRHNTNEWWMKNLSEKLPSTLILGCWTAHLSTLKKSRTSSRCSWIFQAEGQSDALGFLGTVMWQSLANAFGNLLLWFDHSSAISWLLSKRSNRELNGVNAANVCNLPARPTRSAVMIIKSIGSWFTLAVQSRLSRLYWLLWIWLHTTRRSPGLLAAATCW